MKKRMIDLTFPIHPNMMTFPVSWHPKVEVTILGHLKTTKRETRKIVLGTHTGTHCDAPRHFIPRGKTVDQLSMETLIGPALLLNMSDKRQGTAIGVEDLRTRIGKRRPTRLILRYDWSERFGRSNYYSSHSYLTEDAAHWLVSRGVRLLAMDTPMPDDPRNGRGTSNDSPNHKILLGSGVVLVEYLCNLNKVRTPDVFFIALPLKIAGGDGAPTRCIAIEGKV